MRLLKDTSIESLTESQCWEYLNANFLGRLALVGADGVDIFPVNYTANGVDIFFRTAPGLKMVELTRDPVVAFEVDGADGVMSWSVVVRGKANRLGSDPEIESSHVLQLDSQSPTQKFNYVKIVPRVLSGRRFE
jgi:nitroimidazol reductase NimA-like FMN-containing flavoprotein (pyridoxamine 5'-phosphate oxidase superfamily)